MKKTLVLSSFLILVGCVAQHQETIPQKMSDNYKTDFHYNLGDKFGVMLSRDGKYETIDYVGSGMIVALRIKEDLHKIFREVILIKTIDRQKAIDDSKEQNIKYLLIPVISHWEDRATNWSGKPDIIKVQLSLYDVDLGRIVNSVLFNAESSWWTLVNTAPQEMLDQSFEQAVLGLLKS